jgi:hypothetical protein
MSIKRCTFDLPLEISAFPHFLENVPRGADRIAGLEAGQEEPNGCHFPSKIWPMDH